MNTYTGTAYNMTNCLTPAVESNLDQILAASVGYLITLNFNEVMTMYKEFLVQLADNCEVCGLSEVGKSLHLGMVAKGEFWFELNLAANLNNVEKQLTQFVSGMKSQNYAAAGTALGTITSILVPYMPSATLEMVQFSQIGYLTWWNGLIVSLSSNPKKLGPCATFLTGFGNNSVNAASDLSMILDKQWKGFKNFFGDLAAALTYGENTYKGSCGFSALKESIDQILGGDYKLLIERYALKAISINTAISNVKHCNVNLYSCGQGVGTIIKYLLSWSIN